jgi:membrane protein implicated in regulation of membrane protease activity
MSPLPAASREPRRGDSARFRRVVRQQRLRLRRPSPAPPLNGWQQIVALLRRLSHRFFRWSGWGKLATIATALTAVAALWFSAQSLRSTEKQYALSEQGQITDRFAKAVEQLGSDKIDVRLGGIYSLERLAQDSPPDRGVVVEVLGAYVRNHAGNDRECSERIPVDIQAVLTVIQRREVTAPDPVLGNVDEAAVRRMLKEFDQRSIDLSGACLHLATLVEAPLESATLVNTNFSYAVLLGTDLSSAYLHDAVLDGADLESADLSYANLESASLVDTNLRRANLKGANLRKSSLSGADLTDTDLTDILYDATTVWPLGFTPPPSRPHY